MQAKKCSTPAPTLAKPALGLVELHGKCRNERLYQKRNSANTGGFASERSPYRNVFDFGRSHRTQKMALPIAEFHNRASQYALRKSRRLVSRYFSAKAEL